jgi:hypothetical protein
MTWITGLDYAREDFFAARITAVEEVSTPGGAVNAHSWVEVVIDTSPSGTAGGEYVDADPGRSGTADSGPAYEVNNQSVAVGTVVLMRLKGLYEGGPVYEFAAPSQGSDPPPATELIVREVDGAPSVADVGTLEFHQDDGFVVSDQGGGTARVRLDPRLTVAEADGTPTVVNVGAILFDQTDGFTVTDAGGGFALVNVTHPTFNLTVEEVDGAPSLAGIHTIRFDSADGVVVSQPAAGVARIDLSPATFALTVREADGSPAVVPVTVLEFDQGDGFRVSDQGGGVARVDLVDPDTGEPPCDPCLFAAISKTDCVEVTTDAGTFLLAYDVVDDVWTSAEEYTYPTGSSGPFTFWFEGGALHLALDGLELLNCNNCCWRGGPLTEHDSQGLGGDCGGSSFEVCVRCRCCLDEGWYCVDNGGGCPGEALYLQYEDVCDLIDSICSGPYATEAEAQAVCPPPAQEITCDAVPTELPGAYTLTWALSASMAGFPGVLSTCDMIYQAGLSTPVTGPLVWQGTMANVTVPAAGGGCAGCGPHDFLVQQRVSCIEGEIPGSFVLTYESRSSCDAGANWDAWSTLGTSGADNDNGWGCIDPGFAPGTTGGGCGTCCALLWENDAL